MKKYMLTLLVCFSTLFAFLQNLHADDFRYDEKLAGDYVDFLNDMVKRSRSPSHAIEQSSKYENVQGKRYLDRIFHFYWQDTDTEEVTRRMTLCFYFLVETRQIAYVVLYGKDRTESDDWTWDGKRLGYSVNDGKVYVTLTKDDRVFDQFYGKWPYEKDLAGQYQVTYDDN